uniref:Retrovirus-related Pol polyprotein from transposon TNT 1-94 n=1 Tax=Cajanus cajan TaxID=3821 RepID=A0A151U6I4_CAJCA|nr:Retrovirus-related Pol polyprotein from transposon TNT 1-94 [Cajanus cajan]
MKQKFQGSTRVKRAQLQALRKEFEMLQMKEGESVNSYFARTLKIAKSMKAIGESMQESVITAKILRSMTTQFNYVVCSIEESNNLDTMTIDELQSSLLVHEQRMTFSTAEEQVMQTVVDEKGGRGRGRGRGRGSFRGRGRGRQLFNKAEVECFKCHKLGHFQYECPLWEKKAHYAETEDKEEQEDELLLMALVECKEGKKGEWFLDSGCSNHMSSNKEWFSELDENFRHKVKLGNDTCIAVMGKGSVRMLVNGIIHVITHVYYVPELKNNLLSIWQLQEKGLSITIQNKKCNVVHSERGLIMEVRMSANRMFVLTATMRVETCFQAYAEDNSQLWHNRLGHLSYDGLKTLVSKQMVTGLSAIITPQEICTHCLAGKQHRNTMPKKSLWRASKRLQLIHADLCGPIQPTSNSNKKYILSFIDDLSRKTWVYFLSEKSETFSLFKGFKALVEKEAGESIICLRTDRGGEFSSKAFEEFCRSQGIKRQLTAAYTPQQNGVAERKNRTIMNMVRSMLIGRQVPKIFWPEATKWCVHILNRSPTAVVQDQTPEEAWSGVKPSVGYFRVFGCLAHVHTLDQQRIKLDDKSKQCVLFGVSDESKAYRLFDPVNKKIIISKDVIFEEHKSWNWEQNKAENQLEIVEWEEHEGNSTEIQFEDKSNNEEQQGTESQSAGTNVRNKSHTQILEIPTKGRARRHRREPVWMTDYEKGEGLSYINNTSAMLVTETDPVTVEEAVKSKKWRDAMVKEMEAIERNQTWELTDVPKGVKPIGVKWVFKTKHKENGEIDKFKARLVAKGYAQHYGVDYTEVFAPVAKVDTIRIILSMAAQNGWIIFQLDVKSAFLHGELKEEIYVQQPAEFIKKGKEEKVYKLRKALYGLKQAPRAWYNRIEAYFLQNGFERCFCEHTLFTKSAEGGKILIVSLYVDDLIYTGNDGSMCNDFRNIMMSKFDMTDLGKMRYFLGIEILQNAHGIFMCQRKYAYEVLSRFGMMECNAVKNPLVPRTKLSRNDAGTKVDATLFKQVVGSLMYLTATRPDLMYGVSLISRFMANPTETHWSAAKRILRYLKGTTEFGILYKKEEDTTLVAYTDSDFAGDIDDRKSTSGFVFSLGTGAVSWSSKKQPIVTLSTTESEYIAAASCACQCIWIKRILETIGFKEHKHILVLCDSNSAIKLSENPVFHGRSKHIDVRFHFLRDIVREGKIKLSYCSTYNQVADIMTKPLKLEQFVKIRSMLGMIEAS